MSYQERWRYGAIEESDDLFNYREFLIREIEGVSRFRGLGWLETNDLEVSYGEVPFRLIAEGVAPTLRAAKDEAVQTARVLEDES